MSATTASQPARGLAGYAGFRATLKLIGTGPRGSRDLTFDEARAATAALLAGEVTPAQAGAFLVAMRVKGEGADELAGVAQALRDAARALRYDGDAPLVASAGAFDGLAEAPPLGLAASVCAAAAGAAVVTACGTRLGPKNGVTVAEVLAALGGPARPTTAESEAMLARAGVAVVHVGEALPGWEALTPLRDEIGLRGPLHSAEKLVDWFGAQRFVVGHTHGGYGAKLLGALERLGARQAIAVRGIEGSDVLRPGRPVATTAAGPLELPDRLGMTLRGDSDPQLAAQLTRAVLAGDEDGPALRAVTLSAAVRLLAAGAAPDVGEALRLAEKAIAAGAASAALDALLGA
jgi:anthranilate phosphoribosyltransferase